MASVNYQTRRDEIETYFDRTAADAWAALTSDAPVSRIRRTVRRGRDAMRQTLMSSGVHQPVPLPLQQHQYRSYSHEEGS